MKATVTITSRGVITPPAKLRPALGLRADDYVVAEARRNLGAKGPEVVGMLDALLAGLHVAAARVPVPGLPNLHWLPK